MQKIDATAPHEIMLIVDAGTGQNAINQVQLFDEAVGLTGITITKLDGTSHGGVLSISQVVTHVPIRYIGVVRKLMIYVRSRQNHSLQHLFETDK